MSRVTRLRLFRVDALEPPVIYTLSLHDALPISRRDRDLMHREPRLAAGLLVGPLEDRKSTRLNSSHANISYAGFCLKRKAGRGEAGAGGPQARQDRARGRGRYRVPAVPTGSAGR